MSVYDLRAEVSRLESELNRIENINDDLRKEIGVGVAAVAAANKSLNDTHDKITSDLSKSTKMLTDSHQQIIAAYEIQGEIDEIYEKLKIMELANKEIRRCNNIKYYDFATFRTVRKIVQGIMDNMDFSMADRSLIERAVEKEHLESPAFWLTAALIAVVAWTNNEQPRAMRALEQAMNLDDKKTASFMMVFNLRVGREEAAFKWFEQLLSHRLTGSDKELALLFFSMLSKTMRDSISDSARGRVNDYVRNMIDAALSGSATSRDDAVTRIMDIFQSFANDFSFSYPLISQHVSTASMLKTSLVLARNNQNITDFINGVIDVDDSIRNEFLKEYIDRIVEEPSATEADVYDTIELNELIIKYQGDKSAANIAFSAAKEHRDAELDIVSEMIRWVYTVEGREECNEQMRKNMVVLTDSIHQDAGDRYINSYRALFGSKATASVNDFQGDIDLFNPSQSFSAIESHFKGLAQAEKAEIKDIVAIIVLAVSVIAGIGLAVAVSPVMAVVGIAGAAAGGGMLLLNNKARSRIDAKYKQLTEATKATFEAIGDEFKKLYAEFSEADMLSSDLESTLSSL